MIRIVNWRNRSDFDTSMRQYFKLRYDVFVSELGWREPNPLGEETDQYDDENAVYILSLDARDQVVGCFRLYPTSLPHMLSEHFAYMMDGPVLQKEDVFELTRFAVAAPHRSGGVVYRELYLGMLEYCLDHGIEGIVALMRTTRLSPLLGIGLYVRPLALPKSIGGESNVVAHYTINRESLMRVQSGAGVHRSVLETNIDPVSHVA